jgi:hypothetical protein
VVGTVLTERTPVTPPMWFQCGFSTLRRTTYPRSRQQQQPSAASPLGRRPLGRSRSVGNSSRKSRGIFGISGSLASSPRPLQVIGRHYRPCSRTTNLDSMSRLSGPRPQAAPSSQMELTQEAIPTGIIPVAAPVATAAAPAATPVAPRQHHRTPPRHRQGTEFIANNDTSSGQSCSSPEAAQM